MNELDLIIQHITMSKITENQLKVINAVSKGLA